MTFMSVVFQVFLIKSFLDLSQLLCDHGSCEVSLETTVGKELLLLKVIKIQDTCRSKSLIDLFSKVKRDVSYFIFGVSHLNQCGDLLVVQYLQVFVSLIVLH